MTCINFIAHIHSSIYIALFSSIIFLELQRATHCRIFIFSIKYVEHACWQIFSEFEEPQGYDLSLSSWMLDQAICAPTPLSTDKSLHQTIIIDPFCMYKLSLYNLIISPSKRIINKMG